VGLVPILAATIPYKGDSVELRLEVSIPGRGGEVRFGYEGKVDTGFSGGIRGTEDLCDVLEAMGLEPTDTTVRIANDKILPAWLFPIRILAIVGPTGATELSTPWDTILLCFAAGSRVAGFGAIAGWITELDGPRREMRILLPGTSPEAEVLKLPGMRFP
jgi:hypothetical protein